MHDGCLILSSKSQRFGPILYHACEYCSFFSGQLDAHFLPEFLEELIFKNVFWMQDAVVYRRLNHRSAGTVTMILAPLLPATPYTKIHRIGVRGRFKSQLTLSFYAEHLKKYLIYSSMAVI